jgi:hypothetical protein
MKDFQNFLAIKCASLIETCLTKFFNLENMFFFIYIYLLIQVRRMSSETNYSKSSSSWLHAIFLINTSFEYNIMDPCIYDMK